VKCLVDADILRYELGYCAHYTDDDGVAHIRNFDFVKDLFDQKILEIEGECWADEPSLLYLTGKNNFRNDIAKLKPYKGNRKGEKPFHYENLTAYIKWAYPYVEVDILEADDQICIDHRLSPDDTIICTRDKDLRMVEGRHFGWPCGKQPQFGPCDVDYFGEIRLIVKDVIRNGKPKKEYDLKGEGISFFYSQLLIGDSVDNIPGLPGCGVVKAYPLLSECTTEEQLKSSVQGAYEEKYGAAWLTQLTEQAQLLYMIREIDDDGQPVHWRWE
jgi:hypothetical protein